MAGIIAQPKSDKGAPAAATQAIGAPPTDANRKAVNGLNYIQTNDSTPVNNIQSPQTIPATPLALTIPLNAITITIIAAAALNVSEVSDMSQYFAIPANVPVTLNVARQGLLYLAAPTGTVVTGFFFQTL